MIFNIFSSRNISITDQNLKNTRVVNRKWILRGVARGVQALPHLLGFKELFKLSMQG